MTGGPLERRYRRLLAWYPAGHRAVHEEEMLAVLFAGAREGQRRPRPAEAADLLRGALRSRLRPPPPGAAHTAWRDALAVVSVAAPVLVLVQAVAWILLTSQLAAPFIRSRWLFAMGFRAPLLYPPSFGFSLPGVGAGLLLPGLLALAVLALLRLRRVAAVVALALTAWFSLVLITTPSYGSPVLVFGLFVFVLETAALAFSPGPRRGLALFTRTGVAVLLVAALALAAVAAGIGPFLARPEVALGGLAVIAALAIGLAIASPVSRRVLVLFAIPAMPFLVMQTHAGFFAAGPSLLLVYLPPLLISCGALAAFLRARRRAVPG